MDKVTFEWGGTTFTVRPLTVYENDRRYSLFVDIGEPIIKDYGYEGIDDIPNTLDVMLGDYLRWQMVTTADSETEVPLWGNWFAYAIDKKTDKAGDFKKWLDIVHANDDLLSLWMQAYKQANAEVTTKVDEKKDEISES